MSTRSNTIAGWTLAAAIVLLGLNEISGIMFKAHAPQSPGYPIVGTDETVVVKKEIPMATMLASADLAKGKALFAKCSSCHTINAGGANGIGPNLYAILGKPHAGVSGFAYSSALKSNSAAWNFDNMNAWLISPRKYAPGTKMSFAGFGNPADRANVIAYLNAQGSDMPLPVVPVEAVAPAVTPETETSAASETTPAATPAEAEASAITAASAY